MVFNSTCGSSIAKECKMLFFWWLVCKAETTVAVGDLIASRTGI